MSQKFVVFLKIFLSFSGRGNLNPHLVKRTLLHPWQEEKRRGEKERREKREEKREEKRREERREEKRVTVLIVCDDDPCLFSVMIILE
jgi:hypothetical protein